MTESFDIIVSKIDNVDHSIDKIDGKIDGLTEKVANVNVIVAGMLPRLNSLESRQESDRRRLENEGEYRKQLQAVIEKKIEDSVIKGVGRLDDKVDMLDNELRDAKKKLDELSTVNNKFDNWQEERIKEKHLERMLRAIWVAVGGVVTFIYLKLPVLVKNMGL